MLVWKEIGQQHAGSLGALTDAELRVPTRDCGGSAACWQGVSVGPPATERPAPGSGPPAGGASAVGSPLQALGAVSGAPGWLPVAGPEPAAGTLQVALGGG